jgi:hypothetical protein
MFSQSRKEGLRRNEGCRPYGTRVLRFLPGTYVPGFRVSPLRGWSYLLARRLFAANDEMAFPKLSRGERLQTGGK